MTHSLFKFMLSIVLLLLGACAVMPGSGTPSPWGTPNRNYDPGSEQQRAELSAAMQPCIEHARSTFPEILRRYQAGQFAGARFLAIIYSDARATTYVDVEKVEQEIFYGRIDTGDMSFNGQYIPRGGRIVLRAEDIIDWYVLYPDRPPQGNLLGRYLLQRMDGLVSGDCDPNHREFQQYRVFTWAYSFVPAEIEGWDMRGSSQDTDVSLHQNIGNFDVLNTLSGSSYRIEPGISDRELIDYARSFGRYGDEEGVRYKVVKLDAGLYQKPGARCARSDHVVEDSRALLSRGGKRGFMIRDVQSLVCVHPADENIAVALTYSHRHHRGKRDRGFIEKADRVFESLAFRQKDT